MAVYHSQTPVRSNSQSMALFKSHQRAVLDELCKTRPKAFFNPGRTIDGGVTNLASKLTRVNSQPLSISIHRRTA